jgi:shikimate kinase
MRIFLTGVGCVGKTTIGRELAALLGYQFFDLDMEIEEFFGTSIERLQKRWLTAYFYRNEASRVLKHVLSRDGSQNCVIALPPSGLMDSYWRVVKKAKATIIVLQDEPENILNRITFYDIDSCPIDKKLTEQDRRLYLREIKEDITYFRRTYQRADITVNIGCLGPEDAAHKVKDMLTPALLTEAARGPKQQRGADSDKALGRSR